jgi:hypothetical protein
LEKSWLCTTNYCSVWVHQTVRWCIGQCPVRQTSLGEQAALGTRRRRTAIIHRTVRWCTGLSDGAPDCPVSRPRRSHRSQEKFNGVRLKFTGLSGEPTVDRATVVHAIRGRRVGDAWPAPTVGRRHRTVSGALTAANLQRSTAPK